MGNKILVEFDKKELEEMCKNLQEYPNHWCYHNCQKTDDELIDCVINGDLSCGYTIKEQNNGKD